MQFNVIMNWIDIVEWAFKYFALLISVVAVIVGIWQFRRQHKLSFFERYTSRYQHIMEIMPESVLEGKPLPKNNQEQAIHAIWLYIDLCSEEFYLHKQKYIEEKVWEEWKGGMEIMFALPAIKEVFEKKYMKSYEDFAEFAKKELFKGDSRKSTKE